MGSTKCLMIAMVCGQYLRRIKSSHSHMMVELTHDRVFCTLSTSLTRLTLTSPKSFCRIVHVLDGSLGVFVGNCESFIIV